MTFRQAFTSWSMIPKNIASSANCREPVNRVLMKKYSDVELAQFTEEKVRDIFKTSGEIQEFKTRAASVLVRVLEWGAENGHCSKPSFDYTVVSVLPCSSNDDTQPPVRLRGKAPHPVAQLDAVSRDLIRVWPSRAQAERELGIRNIDRAVARRGLSGGFFWCNPEDIEDFEPSVQETKPAPRVSERIDEMEVPAEDDGVTVIGSAAADSPKEEDAQKSLKRFDDNVLIQELIRRGWRGTIEIRQVAILK